MPCIMTLLALAAPRLVVAVLWFFTHWFRGVFDNILWPIIGFVFLPTTLLWYSAVHNWFGGHWSFWPVVGLVISLLIDLGPVSGRRARLLRWRPPSRRISLRQQDVGSRLHRAALTRAAHQLLRSRKFAESSRSCGKSRCRCRPRKRRTPSKCASR